MVLALLLALIHRSAWKGNSANFAPTAFYEVGLPALIREAFMAEILTARVEGVIEPEEPDAPTPA